MKNPSTPSLPAICILLFVICSLQLEISHAQNYQWAKSFGDTLNDSGYSIAVDASGKVYTTGYFYI